MRGRWLFFFVLLLTGCSNPTTGPSARSLEFTGRVLDDPTNAPVGSARIAFSSIGLVEPPSEAVTSATGDYVATVPRTGGYSVTVDGVFAGVAQVSGSGYRGDIFVHRANCVMRYGRVIDSRTLIRVRNATVTLTGTSVRTDNDGWYQIELGCADGPRPSGTTVLTVTHPDYQDRAQVVGRGVFGVSRLDVTLTRERD
jgi:hypothetical protein